jgi:hypothetical protein
MAIRLANALEDCNLLFIEEPVLPENVDALVTVARSIKTPVATGERLFTRWGFREILEKQAAVVSRNGCSRSRATVCASIRVPCIRRCTASNRGAG